MRSQVHPAAALAVVAILAGAGIESGQAAELVLDAGSTHAVDPDESECVTSVAVRNDGPFAIKEVDCKSDRATMILDSGSAILPNTVDITAVGKFVTQFRVDSVPGASAASLLPVLITVPVKWKGVLSNNDIVPPVGPLDVVGTHIDVNMSLSLYEGDPSDPAAHGRLILEDPFQGVGHAGISGCLSVPKTKVQAAVMLAKCVLGVFQRDEGSGVAHLSAVIETGTTYNVELELRGDLYAFNVSRHQATANFEGGVFGTPFGLTWDGPMAITIGTDFQSNIQGLQDQIDELRAELLRLREDFEGHTHEYRTGRGVGHNNTVVSTSGPVVVDDAQDVGSPSGPGASSPAVDPPSPFIGSVSLVSGTGGGANTLTLGVFGSGFVPGSLVRWDGVPRETTFVDSTHLECGLPRRDAAGPGQRSVTVVNPGGVVSNEMVHAVK